MNGQIVETFKAEIEAAGLRPHELVSDGKMHRCPVEGKPDARDGAYVLHPDEPVSGWCINWRTGEERTWTTKRDQPLTEAERQKLAERVEANKRERQAEQARQWTKAAEKASAVLDGADPCREHPYLKNKGVKPCPRLKVDHDQNLLVPVLGPNGKVQSLQTITPAGDKRFMAGGKMAGGYFPIRGKNTGALLLCEGLATGLSLHEATGATVLCAFTAGNMEAVARLVRGRNAKRTVIVCGDDDHVTEGNPGRTKAEAAARSVGGIAVLPAFKAEPPGTDFNDLHLAEGLEVVGAQVEAVKGLAVRHDGGRPNAPTFIEPVRFDEYEAPPIPPEVLPTWARDFALAACEHLQVPFELVMANVLGVVATAVSRKFKVEIKPGYQETLCLYLLAPAPPAERKSGTQALCTAPLVEWEQEQVWAMADAVAEKKSERKSLEAIIASMRGRLAKQVDRDPERQQELVVQIAEMEKGLPEVPHPPRLLGDDLTPEAAAHIMASNDERLGIVSAEGGIFDILAGRYSGNIPNLDLFLKAHSGDAVRVDRRNGPPVIMDDPALTLCLSPQPEVMLGLVEKPGFRGRGLLGRFVYILPKSMLGRRKIQTNSIPVPVAKAYALSIRTLLEQPWARNDHNEPIPILLTLDSNAFSTWSEFAEAVEAQLADGGRFETIRDWAGKLPGLAGRLAALLHCMEHLQAAPELKITRETMAKGVTVASILIDHALAAFGMMGADPELEAAKRALTWIRQSNVEEFTARDCHRALRGSYPKAEAIHRALDVLEDRAFIFEKPQEQKRTSGRRPSPAYIVNRLAHQDRAN